MTPMGSLQSFNHNNLYLDCFGNVLFAYDNSAYPKIRLIVQPFSTRLFDTLQCHYSRMKDVLAIQQEQKYKRHRPETTLLYQLVERYYYKFTANLAEQSRYLPNYVEREFDDFLRCRLLE